MTCFLGDLEGRIIAIDLAEWARKGASVPTALAGREIKVRVGNVVPVLAHASGIRQKKVFPLGLVDALSPEPEGDTAEELLTRLEGGLDLAATTATSVAPAPKTAKPQVAIRINRRVLDVDTGFAHTRRKLEKRFLNGGLGALFRPIERCNRVGDGGIDIGVFERRHCVAAFAAAA